MIRHTLLVFIEALLSSARIAVTCPSISGARIGCAVNPPQVPKAMLSILCDTAARFHASRFIRGMRPGVRMSPLACRPVATKPVIELSLIQ